MQSFLFDITFYVLAVITIISGCVTAFSQSLVRAAFALFVTLMGLSGFFILLGSDFLAIVQVVVYVGGILTLLLFGILLTNRTIGQVSGIEETAADLPATILGLFAFVLLFVAIIGTNWLYLYPDNSPYAFAPKTSDIGALLLSRHLLAFELAGVLLLAALLGAAYLVRKRDL